MEGRVGAGIGPAFQAESTDVIEIDFESIGPRAGTRFPDVTLPDQHGRPMSLHDDKGSRQALIVFVRSADW